MIEHHHSDREPENCIGAVDLATGMLDVLAAGHDFYASPRLSPDGKRLVFVAWDHPNMPWDGTDLKLAELSSTSTARNNVQRYSFKNSEL